MQFKNIKNQHVLINHLTEIIDAGRISHAQLFLGETQSGSLAMAIAYMQYLCCTNRQHYHEDANHHYHTPDGSPTLLRADSCGTCPSCAKFEALMHSDLHFVFPNITSASRQNEKPSSEDFQAEFMEFLRKYGQYGTLNQWYEELSVENKQGMIREQDAANIVKYISMTTYEAPYKMVVVWCAEKMNISAANELLKTLEEPIGKTLIILVAESTERLLSTIISRTQEVSIPPLQNNTYSHNEVYAPLFVAWMRMLFKLNMARLSEWVDQVAKMGREPQKEFLLYCMESLRECLLRNVTQNTYKPLIDFGDDKFNQSFYAVITPRNISLMNEALNHTLMAIERNASPALAFMALSFKMSSYISKK